MQAAQQMQSLNPMAIQAQLRAMYPEMSHEEVMARTRWTITQLQQQQLRQMQQQAMQSQLYGGGQRYGQANRSLTVQQQQLQQQQHQQRMLAEQVEQEKQAKQDQQKLVL